MCIGNSIRPNKSYGFNGWIDRIIYKNGEFSDSDISKMYEKSVMCSKLDL